MRVSAKSNNGVLQIFFHPDSDDRIVPSERYRMDRQSCFVSLPKGFSLSDLHPDHFALVAILLCSPFIGKRLELPRPISHRFFKSTEVISRYSVGPVDDSLELWRPISDSRPAIAFSGGVDSSAALSIMPSDTVPVFLDRPISGRSLYDKDAPYKICTELIDLGFEVHSVKSDLEYLRSPIGFPVDLANSVPAVLLAELASFNSIAFGTIMESAYGIGHREYRHYPEGNHFRLWGRLFEAAGIPLNLPVAGISEVGTSIICSLTEIGNLSQSCIRGKWKKPCRNCWKCYRKILLDLTVKGEELDHGTLDELFSINEAILHLSQFPIKHENVLTYISSKYDGGHRKMTSLKNRVRGNLHSFDWIERWNPESDKLIIERYRDSTVKKITSLLKTMNSSQINEMKSWDMSDMLNSEYYKSIHSDFVNEIS